MSARDTPESGLYTDDVMVTRESVTGEVETDPEYEYFSDNIRDWSFSPGVNVSRRDGVGTPDAVDHDRGMEEPEIEVVYDLQRPLVDSGSGDPADFSADSWIRTDANRIPNTHQVRIVEERDAVDPDDPDGVSGVRTFVIGLGAHPNADMELDPEDGEPVNTTLSYMCEKVREYEVYQPDGDMLTVELEQSSDTGITVTIESDDGSSEEVDMSADSQTTTDSFSSIRAIELSDDIEGDLTVTNGSGTTLATIRGAAFYGDGEETLEGDRGIPAIGSGSEATAVSNPYVYFRGAQVTRGGNPLDYDLNRMTIGVENGYDSTPRHDTARGRYNEGNRETTVESDVVGWGASLDFYDDALGMEEDDIVILLTNTKFTFPSCVVTEPGDKERASDDTAVEYSVTFDPTGAPMVTNPN